MKKIILLITAGFLLLASLLNGQEKRNEQKIKVVIDKGSGKETVIDTVFNGDKMIDSLKLKNGEVIYFNKDGDDNEDITVVYNKKNGPGEHREVRKNIVVTVAGPDSSGTRICSGKRGSYSYSFSSSGDDNDMVEKRYKVISKLENGGKHSGEKYAIVTEKGSGEDSDRDIINLRSDRFTGSEDSDITRYVISKDGVRVTIEGNDDAKIQELVKEIEKKLDIGKKSSESKGTGKEAGK